MLRSILSADEVVALYAALESKTVKDGAQVRKEYALVLCAAHNGQKQFFILAHFVPSISRS